ncbi:hypothetical protein VSH64_37965 [Amycolatopsis rhabdoformis]|uniref:SPW_0924 family protein n=1 Tax=Amycolatopsis rhabdoformis TaxID=1448059 RepID=A0ABZ1I2G9_9PSEU|nr:hypothetical protein [Amycolatopsis rhabdoformis]WSE28572.1 hypothetical protein VSH64_37965 [Amycolatopsis rhabdoformis]
MRIAVVAALVVAVAALLAVAFLRPPAPVPAQQVVTTSRPAAR